MKPAEISTPGTLAVEAPTASTLFPHPAFQAWRRRRVDGKAGRWIAVAEGQTEREVWERLAVVMAQSGAGSFDSLILPGGQEP